MPRGSPRRSRGPMLSWSLSGREGRAAGLLRPCNAAHHLRHESAESEAACLHNRSIDRRAGSQPGAVLPGNEAAACPEGPHLMLDRDGQETIVMNSGLDWTVFKPPRLVNGAERPGTQVGPELVIALPRGQRWEAWPLPSSANCWGRSSSARLSSSGPEGSGGTWPSRKRSVKAGSC